MRTLHCIYFTEDNDAWRTIYIYIYIYIFFFFFSFLFSNGGIDYSEEKYLISLTKLHETTNPSNLQEMFKNYFKKLARKLRCRLDAEKKLKIICDIEKISKKLRHSLNV